jgi:hypothetical protein
MNPEPNDASSSERSPADPADRGPAGPRPSYAGASFAQSASASSAASRFLPWLGAVAAFFAAVLFYRVVYRIFAWVFSYSVSGVLEWLGIVVLFLGALFLAQRLWLRWRLVFSLALAFFGLWTVGVSLPRTHAAVSQPQWGGTFERFDFVQIHATKATAVVLLVVAVVLLFGDVVLAWLRGRSAR